ncbi:phospholipase/lecithinase/hemolysin [Rivularia sp. PCC 7116]|uniref:SGNH/GDSL hydrolase family protein n=1 Tax=Rivularia sp. PCC 7116 TaxID=373994 RepID=UPI00029F220F|nr:SGNH/GDSL hydrolase family protein [Rivularia sp. PCC 7116]AFY57671.1 phospholipase/lecithinase/hemolysin [Rivularia sp. PCC 7116]
MTSITNISLLKDISPQITSQNSFTSFITFGDSLADVGNLFITTRSINPNPPSPPYADGRFSNGELVPEIIAKELGLSASTPSLAGGDNYAFGTAETGSGFSDEGLPNVGEQIKTYLDIDAPAEGDLFFITAGSNNFFPDIDEEVIPDNISTPASVLEGLTENITTLADAGAENFIIPNIALLGSLPFARNEGISDALNTASTEFNSLLGNKLDDLENELGINIIELDVASEIAQILANPSAFGLTNVSEPALNTETLNVVPNPNEYFWWDEFHATSVVSSLVAQSVIDEIPKDTVGFRDTKTPANFPSVQSLSISYSDYETSYSIADSGKDTSNYTFSFGAANEYLNSFVFGESSEILWFADAKQKNIPGDIQNTLFATDSYL